MNQSTNGLDFVETAVEVRYADTDQMGVAHHANYFLWFEIGRVAWCRAHGFHYRNLETEHGRVLVVVEVNCRYKAPARFDDELLVRTAVDSASEKVIRFVYEIHNRRTGTLLATGESKHVVTDRDLRPARLPESIRGHFAGPGL